MYGSKYHTNPNRQFGSSWWLAILPYLEERSIPENWEYTATNGHLNLAGGSQHDNVKYVKDWLPDYTTCPSSPLVKFQPSTSRVTSGQVFKPTYAGISGATGMQRATGATGIWDETRISVDHAQWGTHSAGGVLFQHATVKFADLLDGTSKTLMVGEQSAFGFNPPSDFQYELRSCGSHTGFMGAEGFLATVGPTSPGLRAFNVTTIRYPINQKTRLAGMHNNVGHNNGIRSSHPGGAQVLLGDGSVRFLAENLNLLTLHLLATRDDGRSLGEF